jgi:hypothetical protein
MALIGSLAASVAPVRTSREATKRNAFTCLGQRMTMTLASV